MTPLQKLPKNVGDLGNLIVAKGFKKLAKVQKIVQSGHTDLYLPIYLVDVVRTLPKKIVFTKKLISRAIVQTYLDLPTCQLAPASLTFASEKLEQLEVKIFFLFLTTRPSLTVI